MTNYRWGRRALRANGPLVMVLAMAIFVFGGTGSNCGLTTDERCHGCRADQIFNCGFCVTPFPEGSSCDLRFSTCFACATGLSCVPDPLAPAPNIGRCLDLGMKNGVKCQYGQTPDLCTVGTFCRSSSCGPNGSVCAPVRLAGDSCDSDSAGVKCLPCDIGLECDLSSSTSQSPLGTCRETCKTPSDCDRENLCQPGRQCLREVVDPVRAPDIITRGTGLCYHCANLHDRCNADLPCCGQEQECQLKEGAQTGNETCCGHIGLSGEIGAECSTVDDCCGAGIPNTSLGCYVVSRGAPKTCQALCRPTGHSCTHASSCCTGLCDFKLDQCVCLPEGQKCAVGAECCSEICSNGVCALAPPRPPPPPRKLPDGGACAAPLGNCSPTQPCCSGATCTDGVCPCIPWDSSGCISDSDCCQNGQDPNCLGTSGCVCDNDGLCQNGPSPPDPPEGP